MWKYTSYLQNGLSHKVAGIGCQDSVLAQENEYCIVAALSDGLGSLTNSHIASATATQGIWDIFSSLGEETLNLTSEEHKQQFAACIVEELTNRIHAAAAAHEVAVSTMDCTLAFVYISKIHHYAVVGRLGDSAICVIMEENSVAINDGGHSANGTSAILDRDAASQLKISVWNIQEQNIYGFLLSSDGLDGEVYMKGSPQVKKAAEVYFNSVQDVTDPQSAIRERIALLTADKDSFFDDDISVAVISCAESAIILPNDPTWLCTCGARNRLQDTYCVSCNNDFIALYRNVRFREHGGKSAFFTKINQDPEGEKRLIGLIPEIPTEPAKKEVPPQKEDVELIIPVKTAPPKSPTIPATRVHNEVPGQRVRSANRVSQPTPKTESQNTKHKNPKATGAHKNTNKTKRRTSGLVFACGLCIVALILGCLIGSNTQKKILSSEVEQLENIIAEQEQQIHALEQSLADKTPPEETTDTEDDLWTFPPDFKETADGRLYWGNTTEGVLNGPGVSLENGYYYMGTFQEGKKIGTFFVFSKDNFDKTILITFDDNGILTDLDSHWNKLTVKTDSLDMRVGPGAESNLICCLYKEDVVYITQAEPIDIDGQKWVEIICNNTIGWVDSSGLSAND